MKRSFFDRHALLVLMLVVFFVPFGMRGARMAVRGMRNDVKDWLPDRFEETTELAEFREHFGGEGFVVISWDDCRGTLDDQRFRLFVDKFFRETPPSERAATEERAQSTTAEVMVDEELGVYARQLRELQIDHGFVGNKLGLYVAGNYHHNWGGLDEKWLKGDGGIWYYVLPNGEIHKWLGHDTPLAALGRTLLRAVGKQNPLQGELVARVEPEDGPWFHKDPRRLEADLFKTVTSGPAMLSDLTRPGGALDGEPEKALERLTGWLYGPDGEQTCLFVKLTDRGARNLHRIVGRGLLGKPRGKLLELAEETGLFPPPRPSLLPPPFNTWVDDKVVATGPVLRLGGPPLDNVAIDEEGQVTLVRLVGLSAAIGLLISWLSFRNLAVVLTLSFVGLVSASLSISFVWWGGSRMDAVLMSMPSLVYVLGLSGAVHIVNYYRDTVKEFGFPGRPTLALAHGWKPCTLAAITTALGLGSLATSDIVPIRKFGIFAAIGVVFSLTLLFTFLPAALTIWPPKNFVNNPSAKRRKSLSDIVGSFWQAVGVFVLKRHTLVTVASLAMLLAAGYGLPRMKTSVKILNLFQQDNKLIQDYAWLEQRLGKLVPVELMVRVAPDMMVSHELEEDQTSGNNDERFRLNYLERMELTEHVRRSIDAHFGPNAMDKMRAGITGQAMLASTFVPPLPAAGGGTLQTSTRGAFSRQLANYREKIEKSGYFDVDDQDDSELWRISLRLSALNDVDYGMFVSELKTAVEPVMAAYRYRDQVLRTIDEQRGENGFRGGRVMLLGVPFGKSPLASTPTAEALAAVDEPQGTTDKSEDHGEFAQHVTFSTTLVSLLKNAALNYRDWHDPRYELPVDWHQRAADYDCVLIFADDPRYDLDETTLSGTPVVDLRDHVFHPASGQQTAAKLGHPISTKYTGLVPIVYKAQRTLLQSLIESTGWAFLAISLVMIMVLRSPTAGLISMIPNIFPIVMVFGLMSWRGITVDIGSMMTASVAMGVAVDDTVHFLTWFRRGLDEGLSRNGAIRMAYERCATAMTQTTLIAGLGLFVFALSSFTPTRRFGILMLSLMVAALIGDLVFLPALLAGPAGRAFGKSKKTKPDQGQPPDSDSGERPREQRDPAPTGIATLPEGDSASSSADPPTNIGSAEASESAPRRTVIPGKPHIQQERKTRSSQRDSRAKWHL